MKKPTTDSVLFWMLLALTLAASVAATRADEGAALPISIGVSPPRVELEIGDRPTGQAMRVYNFGAVPAEIRVSVHAWTLDENNRVTLTEPTEQSLDQWIAINPIAFTVPPGEFQTVRFAVRPKVQPLPGEHRAILYFTQLPAARPASQEAMRVVGRVGAAVYGYVGEVERRATLNGVQVDIDQGFPVARLDVTSEGTAHARLAGHYAIWRAEDYPGAAETERVERIGTEDPPRPDGAVMAAWLPRLPVLPGQRRDLEFGVMADLQPGRYVLDVDGEIGGARVDIGVPFTIRPEAGASGARP